MTLSKSAQRALLELFHSYPAMLTERELADRLGLVRSGHLIQQLRDNNVCVETVREGRREGYVLHSIAGIDVRSLVRDRPPRLNIILGGK